MSIVDSFDDWVGNEVILVVDSLGRSLSFEDLCVDFIFFLLGVSQRVDVIAAVLASLVLVVNFADLFGFCPGVRDVYGCGLTPVLVDVTL